MVMVSRSWYSLVLQGIVWYCMVWRSWKVMVSRSWTASALQDFLDSLMTLWAFGVQNLSIDGEKNTTICISFSSILGRYSTWNQFRFFSLLPAKVRIRKTEVRVSAIGAPGGRFLLPNLLSQP